MIRLPIPGGTDAIALPVPGVHAVRFPGLHIQTSSGPVEFPPGDEVGYLDITTARGGLAIAGQGQRTYEAWLYDNGIWTPQGPNNGTYPAAFDGAGELHIIRPGPGQSSQGFRYPDEAGNLVPGDDTYNDRTPFARALGVTELGEWSCFAGVAIGQGARGGTAILSVADGRRFLLEEGDIRNPRVRYDPRAKVFAIAFFRAEINTSVMYWVTRDELLTQFQSYPPAPPPPPPPPERPMSYTPQAPDITTLIRQLAQQHPLEWAEAYEYEGHPRTDRFVRLLATAAHAVDPRFGLNGKRGTDTLSLDVLAFKNPTVPAADGGVELRDFIYDSGSPGNNPRHEITWNDATIPGVAGKWIAPTDAPSEPLPATTVDSAVRALIEAAVAPLRADISALKAQKPPTPPSLTLTGRKVALRTNDGHYVCAENGGGGEVNATRNSAGGWETVTLEEQT